MSQNTESSQTAQEFIASQLQLEADAREALPYQFDTCTKPLGPLRQAIFACLTCNPPSTSDNKSHTPAAVCYSCSISCHGEHELVELFTKRNFVCDCGTTRVPASAPCTLRIDESTSQKGNVTGETPAENNKYNHNFSGRFCACGEPYDPEKEKGTMFQCLGLGTVEDGGCGEDWWHPECLMGLPRPQPSETAPKEEKKSLEQPTQDGEAPAQSTEGQEDVDEAPLPPGFPAEDDFDHLICYKCVSSFPWIKQYAGQDGFLAPVYHKQSPASSEKISTAEESTNDATLPLSTESKKRTAEDDAESPTSKKTKAEPISDTVTPNPTTITNTDEAALHTKLPPAPSGTFSLFLKEDFRSHICRCPSCFPDIKPHPQLLEDEEAYDPPVSESDNEEAQNGRGGSVGSGSTYERGEALLSNMDRVKAIEGVMVYNHLRDKVKAFLQPFAESGQAVGAEDIKAYFEKLRGDEEGIKLAGASAGAADEGAEGDGRREQGGH
ncbi:zf-UBR-domain-containing protein [Aureobasidium sp. EXF-10727]|nr:zf-UBR-domain-containing protein [Aureobasidium sp. EXF-10727]